MKYIKFFFIKEQWGVVCLNQEKLEWELPSGTWHQNEKNGYKLRRRSNVNFSHMHSGLLKQLLNLPSFEGQTFPPEFKYHPDTGKKLV